MLAPVPAQGLNGLAMDNEDCPEDHRPRAQRFDLHLPLRYRASGETAWQEGRTENISHTGVLFLTKAPLVGSARGPALEVGTHVEMCLEMSLEGGGEAAARVVCQGEIVRTAPPAGREAQAGLAARIVEYRFVHEM